MTVNRLINLLAIITLVELMITIGVGATMQQVWAVVRDWGCVLRALAANYVVVPAVAVVLVLLFHATPMVAAGAMVIAVCPGAPYGPPFTAIARGRLDRAIGLMVMLAGSSALVAPLLLAVLLPILSGEGTPTVHAGRIVKTLALSQILPLSVGLAIATYRPALAKKIKVPLERVSEVLNVALLTVILAAQFRLLAAIHVRGYFGMACLLVASALAGWLLGGRTPIDRKSLAITTGVRSADVALVIVGSNFPGTPAVTFVTAYALVQTLLAGAVVIAIGRRAKARENAAASAAIPPSDSYREAPTA